MDDGVEEGSDCVSFTAREVDEAVVRFVARLWGLYTGAIPVYC